MKLSELCKTRTEKSSLDKLNFYVISTGYDMVGDTNRANSKLNQKKKKLQNVKFLRKTWAAPNNRLTISDQKLKNSTLGIREQNKGTAKPQR